MPTENDRKDIRKAILYEVKRLCTLHFVKYSIRLVANL